MSKIDYIKEAGIMTPVQLELIQELKSISDRIEKQTWKDDICENDLVDAVNTFLGQVHEQIGYEMMS